MKQIKNQNNRFKQLGFSEIRIRFFVLSFMTFFLLLAPLLGLLASTIVVLIFAALALAKMIEGGKCKIRVYHDCEELIKEFEYEKPSFLSEKLTTESQSTLFRYLLAKSI